MWVQLPCCHRARAGEEGRDPPQEWCVGPSGVLLPTSEDTLGCSPQALVPLGLGPAPPAQAAALPALEVGLREEPQTPPGATHTHQARHSSWHWGRSPQHTLQGPESSRLPLTPRERGEGGRARLESALPWYGWVPLTHSVGRWHGAQLLGGWNSSWETIKIMSYGSPRGLGGLLVPLPHWTSAGAWGGVGPVGGPDPDLPCSLGLSDFSVAPWAAPSLPL